MNRRDRRVTEVFDERSGQRIAGAPSDDRDAEIGRRSPVHRGRRGRRGRRDMQSPHAEETGDRWRRAGDHARGRRSRCRVLAIGRHRRTRDRPGQRVEAPRQWSSHEGLDERADPVDHGLEESRDRVHRALTRLGAAALGVMRDRQRIALSRHDQQRAAGRAVPPLPSVRTGAKLHQGGFGGHGGTPRAGGTPALPAGGRVSGVRGWRLQNLFGRC